MIALAYIAGGIVILYLLSWLLGIMRRRRLQSFADKWEDRLKSMGDGPLYGPGESNYRRYL